MEPMEVVRSFYEAFSRHDAEAMAALYADDVVFHDPGFGTLHGERARNMWRMLLERGGEDLRVEMVNILAENHLVRATWRADYKFGKNKRPVQNQIRATITVDENGKIKRHIDEFDFAKWAGQALGFPWQFLGRVPFFQKKVQEKTNGMLDQYGNRRS